MIVCTVKRCRILLYTVQHDWMLMLQKVITKTSNLMLMQIENCIHCLQLALELE